MKWAIIFVAILAIPVELPQLVLSFEEPNGFVDMKWGESVEQAKEELCEKFAGQGIKWGLSLEECKEKGLFVDSGSPRGNMTTIDGWDSWIGDIYISAVTYFFYGNKLGSVWANFSGISDFNSLRFALKDKYGEPISIESLKNLYAATIGLELKWHAGNVEIRLKYNQAKKEGILSYQYIPIIFRETIKERKEELEKMKKNL